MGSRILLVHANPFQAVLPVPPYGLERISTAILDLDEVDEIRVYDPWLEEDEPLASAAALADEYQPHVIGLSIRIIDDCIVIDTLDGDSATDDACFLPQIRELIRTLRLVCPSATYVCGGAAFSAMAGELLEYLQVELGVVGAGEAAFRSLIRRLAAGRELDAIPGLVHRGEKNAQTSYQVVFPSKPTVRLANYSIFNNIPVRTRIGCAMQCSYCLTSNQLRRKLGGSIDLVIEELDELAQQARACGVDQAPIMFADDEVNLPGDESWRMLLRAIVERPDISAHINWRGYANPIPFDEELAELVKETNGHLCLTVDSAADRVLAANGKPFRRQHLDRTIDICLQRGVSFNVGLIFGLIAESEATIEETAVWAASLPEPVVIDYAPGARVYPQTPLAAAARKEPDRCTGDPTFLFPASYGSPMSPRALARLLDERFQGRERIQRIGDGYARADRTPARLARLLRSPASHVATEAFRKLTSGMLDETKPRISRLRLNRAEQSALWIGRPDLASVACVEHSRAGFLEQRERSALAARACDHQLRAHAISA